MILAAFVPGFDDLFAGHSKEHAEIDDSTSDGEDEDSGQAGQSNVVPLDLGSADPVAVAGSASEDETPHGLAHDSDMQLEPPEPQASLDPVAPASAGLFPSSVEIPGLLHVLHNTVKDVVGVTSHINSKA